MAKAKQAAHLTALKPTHSDVSESEITMRQADELRRKCRGIHTQGKKLSMVQCEAVWESECTVVKKDGAFVYCWALWGYTSWEEFLGKEMDLHLVNGYLLRNVWQVFGIELKGAWDKDLLLGPTKMKLLTKVTLNRKNVNMWLRKAAAMTCKALRAEVYETEEKHTLQLQLTGSQFKQVRGALEIARSSISHGEKMDRAELLTRIIGEWSAGHRQRRAA